MPSTPTKIDPTKRAKGSGTDASAALYSDGAQGWQLKRASVGTFPLTSVGNIDDLNFSNARVIRMNNATLATIRGLVAGVDGQLITIINIGSSVVLLAHQNAGSIAANRLNNLATSASTPLAAGGSATYEYDVTSAYWRMISHDQGTPITAAYSASNFTGSGSMTVTADSIDVASSTYYLQGNQMFYNFELSNISIGGTPNTDVNILNGAWGGFTSAAIQADNSIAVTFDNGIAKAGGLIRIDASTTKIRLLLVGFINWTASTNNTSIMGQISFTVS